MVNTWAHVMSHAHTDTSGVLAFISSFLPSFLLFSILYSSSRLSSLLIRLLLSLSPWRVRCLCPLWARDGLLWDTRCISLALPVVRISLPLFLLLPLFSTRISHLFASRSCHSCTSDTRHTIALAAWRLQLENEVLISHHSLIIQMIHRVKSASLSILLLSTHLLFTWPTTTIITTSQHYHLQQQQQQLQLQRYHYEIIFLFSPLV